MNKAKWKRRVRQAYGLLSIGIAFVSAVLLWYFNVGVHWRNGFFGYRTLFVVGMAYSFTYWFFAKMYNAHKIGLFRLTQLAFSQMLAFGITDFILFVASFLWFHNFRKIRPSYFILAFFLQFFVITGLIFISNRVFARFDEPRKVILIYGSDEYLSLLQKLKAIPYRFKVLGCYGEDSPHWELEKAIDAAADVYLCDVSPQKRFRFIRMCEEGHKDYHMSLTLDDIQLLGLEVSHSLDTPLMRTKKVPEMWYYPYVKRLFDIACSLAALVVLSPIMICIALCIRLEDHGPIFYGQKRLTKDGRVFTIYKFRSMIVDAEGESGARLASKVDDRITKVGKIIRKLRLDELPQLINILKGDMTLVGPRPERPEIAAEYAKDLPAFSQRLKVKAGLTGYAQVYGKYNTTPSDKLKMDLLYISHACLSLDMQIILYTLKIIFIPESSEGI
ncbi:MAG: exopolysaccharide biosynthesis polyprenyl glycosylphosphotransferase [Blautia sp.]|nr:exopolysaccharide biosynthesis polyprenyl glycosylphosphotransferase [Blautia sp.]